MTPAPDSVHALSTASLKAGESAAETAWEATKRSLARSLPESTYRMWLAPVRATAIRADRLYLEAPDSIRTWVERRYTDLIERSLKEGQSGLSSISFEGPAPLASSRAGVRSSSLPNPTHLFDRFVIGPGNHLAHAAALAVAEAPSEAYNPLFLHGEPGLGKTHLLGAIANYLQQNVPELNVLYASAESFTAEFVTALREDGTLEFKRRYRDLDVLLIDDIQFIASKAATEEEFFHTFNTLYESGSQIVLSADRMPTEISTLADRLSDRFEWGLTVPLEQPNLATRLTVLRRLVTEAGLEVSDQEALTLLAKRVKSNLRQLHGALTRSIAEASLKSTPLNSELIQRVFPSRAGPDGPVTPERIREATAAHFQTGVETLESRRRDANTIRARHVAIFLTREMSDLSLPQIGALYGDRDHTTVLNSIRRIDQQLLADPEVTRAVESIRATIHSRGGPVS
ncbi:MAG: chromosomal replication initiator protein DnaA [Thermoleophilia bacterium]|nr:chromosomal replication initiator protein DnaA [Thermoleophilia bacterium]